MPSIKLTVHAEVVDLRSDTPRKDDKFLVDSNVWYWMSYTRAQMGGRAPRPYQTQDYPQFVNAALQAQSTLFRCGLSFSEIAHQIERNERDIFSKTQPQPLKPKHFRHNYPVGRSNVVKEIEVAWSQVEQYTDSVDIVIDDNIVKSALSRIKTQMLDGYDLFMVEAMNQQSITQIITDDSDFVTVPGITVFTANRTAIAAARQSGKLRKR